MPDQLAGHGALHGFLWITDIPDERIVIQVSLRIQVEDFGAVAEWVENPELHELDAIELGLMRNALERQLLKRCMGFYGDGAVADVDLLGRVDRVVCPEVIQLRDVVDAIAVDVSGIGDLVLLHPILVCGQGLQIVRQRGRAVFAPRHRHRDIGGNRDLGADPADSVLLVDGVLRVEHEIVSGG